MSSLSPKDRVSLCSFTFSDGRRCRTPRIGKHPHFCFDHAQKEARARAAESLGKDLAYFFSGNYLSACDLSTALGRLIPAVVRGDVKPKTAHTVAYLMQTLMQAIHISQDEYINAFGTDGWRKSVRNSVKYNHDYRFPPAPHRSGGLQAATAPQPEHPAQPQPQPAQPPAHAQKPAKPQTQPPQPAPSPHTPMPPTSTEFVDHVVAGLQTGSLSAAPPSTPPQPAAVAHPLRGEASRPAPLAQTQAQQPAFAPPSHPPQTAAQPIPAPELVEPPTNCHSERSEESASSESEAHLSHPIPATQFAPSVRPAVQPNNPPPTASPTPKPVQPLDSRALHYDHNYRLRIDGKPF